MEHRCLGRLTRAIDDLYDAGVGEDYLSRLVKSSEENSTQTKHLKDSLVEDLKVLLTDLTNHQIAATHQASTNMAQHIGTSINETLQEPLGEIAGLVKIASGEQGEAVHTMVGDLLAAFTEKLENTVGGQMQGLSTMMAQSVASMQEMQSGFQRLTQDLSQAGDSANKAMSNQLAQMMAEAEARQTRMVETMNAAVTQMQQQISGSQSNTQDAIASALQGMQENIKGMMEGMAKQASNYAGEYRRRYAEAKTSHGRHCC